MKVAYIFSSQNSHMILDKMIVPQLLNDNHGAEVVGMMFLQTILLCLLKEAVLATGFQKYWKRKKYFLWHVISVLLKEGLTTN